MEKISMILCIATIIMIKITEAYATKEYKDDKTIKLLLTCCFFMSFANGAYIIIRMLNKIL